MIIELSVFSVVIVLFILNTILEHLFNWWFRGLDGADDYVGAFVMMYVLKTTAIVVMLYYILK